MPFLARIIIQDHADTLMLIQTQIDRNVTIISKIPYLTEIPQFSTVVRAKNRWNVVRKSAQFVVQNMHQKSPCLITEQMCHFSGVRGGGVQWQPIVGRVQPFMRLPPSPPNRHPFAAGRRRPLPIRLAGLTLLWRAANGKGQRRFGWLRRQVCVTHNCEHVGKLSMISGMGRVCVCFVNGAWA